MGRDQGGLGGGGSGVMGVMGVIGVVVGRGGLWATLGGGAVGLGL